MGDGSGDGTVAWAVMHEKMVALKREVRALTAERDALAARVDALESELGECEEARESEEIANAELSKRVEALEAVAAAAREVCANAVAGEQFCDSVIQNDYLNRLSYALAQLT